ncbi:MBL fold metallo-hydrolase [Nocardioides sp. R-C-SC26]|uniref:MBL fold metallo-hydrolase n=1 Tax=Nocardioides sp. R-C-SC26 TaxID=2870414 RepID=UPI001E64649B|nr:MBL fold metallo-hydrolase [Nocardioides sp. R-C-SC26]
MIHHLNCGTLHPLLAGRFVAHCLLVERADGLLLVDSGFGTADLDDRGRRLGRAFTSAMRPNLDPAETALAQVEALGFHASDVRDIALTHLDLDHAGGVSDFPNATVHVYDAELEAARNPKGMEHGRYLREQWEDARFATHAAAGEEWRGLEAVTVLADDVLLVPLPGHSRGHAGAAVRDTTSSDGGWVLHAGDAYFNAGEVQTPPSCPRILQVFQRLLAQDNAVRLANQERLRTLVADHPDVRVFSAHDASEFEALNS